MLIKSNKIVDKDSVLDYQQVINLKRGTIVASIDEKNEIINVFCVANADGGGFNDNWLCHPFNHDSDFEDGSNYQSAVDVNFVIIKNPSLVFTYNGIQYTLT